MNELDVFIQRRMPVVAFPRHEEMRPCDPGGMRFLMGKGGLYAETAMPWGRLCACLWETPVVLPYGDVTPVDTFADALREVSAMLVDDVVPAAARNAAKGLEWAGGRIIWNAEDGFLYQPLESTSTKVAARYVLPRLPRGTYRVIDVHSHGTYEPRFSLKDDRDDSVSGTKISVVLGSYDPDRPQGPFLLNARYCVNGFLFEPDMAQFGDAFENLQVYALPISLEELLVPEDETA